MKRFVCFVLALVMVMSMMPMSGAADNSPKLMYRFTDYDGDTSLISENKENPLNSQMNLQMGTSQTVTFYYVDSEGTETPVLLSELDFSGVSGSYNGFTKAEGQTADFIDIYAVSGGSGSISYKNDSSASPISVNIVLPDVGFYSSESRNENNYITSFTVTDSQNEFYFVTNSDYTITKFSLSYDLGVIANFIRIGNSVYKITVTGTPSNNADYYAECTYTYADGSKGGNRNAFISIIDGKPGLKYRGMSWDDVNQAWYENTNSPLQSSWSSPKGYNTYAKFYFVSDGVETPVSISEMSWSGSVALSTERNADYLLMDSVGFGSGSVSYTKDGKTYTLPVNISMPELGYYSTPTASAENYIDEFKVTDAQNSFYIVATDGCTIDSVTLQGDFANYATFTIDKSRTYCTITVTNPSLIDERWNSFAAVNFSRQNGSSSRMNMGIRILDYTGTPGAFYTRQVAAPEYQISGDRLNLYAIGSTTIWYIAEDGFTAAEANNVEATATTTNNNAMLIELPDKKPTITPVKREGSELYDLKIELVQPDSTSPFDAYDLSFSGLQRAELTVGYELANTQLKFSIDGVDYAANFIFSDDVNGFGLFEKTNSFGRDTNVAPSPNNPYMGMRELVPGVGSVTTDAQGINVYQKVEGATVEINKVWLETILGEDTTFRFRDSDGSIVASIDNPSAPVRTLAHDGYGGDAFVWANITVTMPGGQTFTGDVSAKCNSTPAKIITCEYEADIHTHPDLKGKDVSITEYLKFIADNYIDGIPSPLMVFEVNLGSGVFDETVIVDSRFSESDLLHLNGALFGDATTVNGINLNDCWEGTINNINFCAGSANAGTLTKGVFNGRFSINQCSFYNYDIAVDSTGFVLPQITNSIFINNDIAWNVDINNTLWRPGNDYNSFINNGIAVKVKCDHSGNSAYYFRITESNFVNNGKDFVADTGSGVYMYRNYFGELKKNKGNEILPGKYAADKHNSLTELRLDEMAACKNAQISQYVQRRPAVIEVADSSTTVIANPRWKYPIKDWWKINNKLEYDKVSTFSMLAVLTDGTSEIDEYEDILVVDWTNSTTIISEEADTLIIDAEAFAEEGSKTIDVVDEEENALGTWTF